MNGPEDVADTIKAALTTAVPERLTAIRAELDVTAKVLPDPALITAQERSLLDLAEWPALFVVVQRLTATMRSDGPTADGAVEYVSRYPFRVFTFVRGRTFEATDLLRKRYVRAVREALLLSQDAIRLDELSWSESYSDVDTDPKTRRTIAGAWSEAVAEVTETLAAPAGGLPAPDPDGWAISTDLDVLPHPALD